MLVVSGYLIQDFSSIPISVAYQLESMLLCEKIYEYFNSTKFSSTDSNQHFFHFILHN